MSTRASESSSSEGGKVRQLAGCAFRRCRQVLPLDVAELSPKGCKRWIGRKLTTVTGVLKGYDQLMNLVMDEVVETYESELIASLLS